MEYLQAFALVEITNPIPKSCPNLIRKKKKNEGGRGTGMEEEEQE